MSRHLSFTRVACLLLLAAACGCEGWNRRTPPPTDLSESAERVAERRRAEGAVIADELEKMAQRRSEYLDQLTRLERLYLEIGDSVRANWARRQREETSAVMVYPYATEKAPEQSSMVRPERPIAEAEKLYNDAIALIGSFRPIPLAGTLKVNQDKARRAVKLLRQLLRDYPTSDRVDDAAYWIGECYKEYLREEDPDNQLAVRYYLWALELDPQTPHPVRFQCAVTYDFRQRDHRRAIEMYRRVVDDHEDLKPLNVAFAAKRIEELADEDAGRDRPHEEREPRPPPPAAEPPAERPAETDSPPPADADESDVP